ncbi:ABC transporter substrate-binding protein [Nitriliruptor alkaliphilus]|uniref:ABC transporter substrate-binding protein n=1 Tax=Nitriliruptor alkaliphilus TaxID=427918 RepID=UPI0006991022|nr:ABC transporter substrate-binding protein [Nitriliruptor alkaliphilus]
MRGTTKRDRRRRSSTALVLALGLVATACGGGGVEGDAAAPESEDGGQEVSDDDGGGGAADDGGAAEGDPIRIGMATTLSGSIALFGEANRNAAQLAVEEINEAGGLLGRPVELIVRDDHAAPEEGVSIARDLIIDEGVVAMLGPVSSGVALAMTEVSAERQVPFIVHTSNTEALTTSSFQPYFVSVVPNTGMEARAQGVDLADEGIMSWATIAPNYEFGQAQVGTFVETIQGENPDVQIIDQQWPELGESDYQPFITAILGRSPEAVYSPLFAGDLVTFSQQAANLGFFDSDVYFTALYETDALRELGDSVDLEGVRAYSRCPFTIDTPEMASFVERYQDRYGEVPSDWACMAYDATMLWAAVVEENGDTDADMFVETVEGFEFTSLRGDITIRPEDHQGSVSSYIAELTYSDEHGMYIYGDITEVPAEDIWLSVEDLEAAR